METNFQNKIPAKFIKEMFLNEHKQFNVKLNYKETLKESVYLFIQYLVTYAEEISKEKNFSNITVFNLKEALIEMDFQVLIEFVEEHNFSNKNSVKQTLKQIK